MISRRNFFTLLGSLAAALGLERPAKSVSAFDKGVQWTPKPLGNPEPEVIWGPGKTHPHWRVPQGRWVVDDPDRALDWNPQNMVALDHDKEHRL